MKNLLSKIRQSGLKGLAAVVLLAAFVCALAINFGVRAPVEFHDKTVGLLVDYDELKRIADGSFEIDFSDMLRKASVAGATGLVVRERILADWEASGDVLVFTGSGLLFQLESQYPDSAEELAAAMGIVPDKTYILTKNHSVYEQLFSILEAKRRYPAHFDYPGYMGIATHIHNLERTTLGLGFPFEQLEEAAAAGFQIIPRIRSWEPVRADNLAVVFDLVSRIPNLAGIGFNDLSVPGGGTNPILLDRIAETIAPIGKPLVSFEFYDQVGLGGLAHRLDSHLLRAHAIAENELQRYTRFQDAMHRYGLAASERNIRYIYVRFNDMNNPAAAMTTSMELVEGVRVGLNAEGLKVGNPEPLPPFTLHWLPIFILGAGVLAAGGWLLALAAEPFYVNKKWRLKFGILMALGCAAWIALLIFVPIFTRKLFAFAAAVILPSLGVILALQAKRGGEESSSLAVGRRMLRTAMQLLIMSALTMMGAMVMSALLAEPAFMIKVDGFMGVKVAHVIPLVLVPVILWLREEDWYGLMSGTVKSSVSFWQLGVALALLAGLALYIMRTGNENPEAVLDIELRVRQLLDRILGVRPRTTEFLVGHPFMLILLYYGYKFNKFPLLMVGLMGQVSLMNTYAHIHTPLMVSLQRTAHGLWMGIFIGVVIIVVLEAISRRMRAFAAEGMVAGHER